MTSLLFWAPYMAHKGVVSHRREKQRLKNYERWEGLRDEYDDQRRATRSLDIQRTGSWEEYQGQSEQGYTPQQQQYNDTPCLSQRDLQERNDARTSWRPQESWNGPRTQVQAQAQMTGRMQQAHPHPSAQRHASTPGLLPLRAQKTGATWDEGLPDPLRVARRSFDERDPVPQHRSASVSGATLTPTPMSRQQSQSQAQSRSGSREQSVTRTHTPSALRESRAPPQTQIQPQMPQLARQYSPPDFQITQIHEMPKNEFGFVEPVGMGMGMAAGGRMAELIERGY